MGSKRWLFKLSDWVPNKEQLSSAFAAIQPEEKEKISLFYFQRDAKSSLMGRLLMRVLISESSPGGTTTPTPFNLIQLGRNDHNKPYLITPELPHLKFNTSHQGDFTVLAAENDQNISQLGVDVMKVEFGRVSSTRTLEDYFKLMRRQFTENEWRQIKKFQNPRTQLEAFIRNWTLKESYVKAIGVGITMELTRIDFQINTEILIPGEVVSDTRIKVDGVLLENWFFEELKIDQHHIIAVALESFPAPVSSSSPAPVSFKPKTFADFQFIDFPSLNIINRNFIKVTKDDEDFAKKFLEKQFAPSSPTPS